MPKFLKQRLAAQAAKEGKTGEAADRYVYGAMNNMGAMHGNKETPKGARMEATHERDHTPHPARNLGTHLKPSASGMISTLHHRGAKK